MSMYEWIENCTYEEFEKMCYILNIVDGENIWKTYNEAKNDFFKWKEKHSNNINLIKDYISHN